MPDFFQTGTVTTLHTLAPHDGERFARDLLRPTRREVTLLLPCLASDFNTPAMARILEVLKKAAYVKQLILILNKASGDDYRAASARLATVNPNVSILWLESKRMAQLQAEMAKSNLAIPPAGKGAAIWYGFGLANAYDRDQNGVVITHDCDIVTYTRELLDRLSYPLSMPDFGYEFAKGYYARVGDRRDGRVVRLFFTPLVRTFEKLIGLHPFLRFVDSFRYPLSGEFGLTTALSRLIRIPGDWGLEIGILSEVYRLCAPHSVCDVEIMHNFYEHKHRALVDANGTGGLRKMAAEIAYTIFRTLAIEGVTLDDGLFRSLRVAYLRLAQDYIRRYADDARIDGINYDRHLEGTAADTFATALDEAIRRFCQDPLASSSLPNWNRVYSAISNIDDLMVNIVAEDAKEFR